MELDDIDRRIISVLQLDATKSIQEVGDEVGLTSNPCWRRIRRLEEAGIIVGRVAVIDAAAIGLGMTAFVQIHTDRHTKDWLKAFRKGVQLIPEIVECHRMTGDVDYLLKIIVQDIAHYDEVYQRLLNQVPDLKDVSAAFSMERLKGDGGIDVSTMRRPAK